MLAVDETLKYDIQRKAAEQYFYVMLIVCILGRRFGKWDEFLLLSL